MKRVCLKNYNVIEMNDKKQHKKKRRKQPGK